MQFVNINNSDKIWSNDPHGFLPVYATCANTWVVFVNRPLGNARVLSSTLLRNLMHTGPLLIKPGRNHCTMEPRQCQGTWEICSLYRTPPLNVCSGKLPKCSLYRGIVAYFERTRTPLTSFIHSFRFSMMFFSSAMLKPVSFCSWSKLIYKTQDFRIWKITKK